ncbi:hypothetical protein [Commensalibacter oyaizuii]|uniref:Uncharacterized protein n=1 Tax=Commensalibacter oyaizuii TaxID=3043873 RepID=A0ABT6Q2J7_9PROT|nr:hypothetical protein [Commensalibacter sp. TBRC 16381]MDI2091313.1 hypothetical protein [Commensalibacter sp. TBRC 16381]
MNLKGILWASTSLILACASFMPSFVRAEDYVKANQINAANGVAGLDSSKRVIAEEGMVLSKPIVSDTNTITKSILFKTAAYDGNNQTVYMFYNPIRSNKKREISESESNRIGYNYTLDQDTFYFTNLRYGNNYRFDGKVTAKELFVIDTPVMPGGYEAVSPYNITNRENDKINLITLTKQGEGNVVGYDWNNVRRNTLMIGGNDRNAIVGIKANCQNTSSGDEGGSCYQFIDMSGPQIDHRSGAGGTDGVNMDIRSSNSSPVDVIGGNKLVKNEDGSYIVKGNDFFLAESVSRGSNSFKVKGIFGCGLAGMNSSGKSKCVVTGINVLDRSGNLINQEENPIVVIPQEYVPSNQISTNGEIMDDGITTVKLPDGYTLKDELTTKNNVNIKFYSADGNAYAVKFEKTRALIYPALSKEEANLIHLRMAIWTNYAKKMQDTERGGSKTSEVDVPDYYYGYSSSNPLATIKDSNNQSIGTILAIDDDALPGVAATQPGWRSYSTKQVDLAPGNNEGDKLDYRLTYYLNGDRSKNIFIHNTNYHHYSQPTLFLGLSDKNFNIYTDQAYVNAPDSITRNFDNEWDFMLHSSRDGMLASHGLTMSWGVSLRGNEHNGLYSNDSYMLNLSGADLMPQGLLINGLQRNGGQAIRTDAGFGVYKWAAPMQELDKAGKAQTIAALGQAKTKTGSYQLLSYMSNDSDQDHQYTGIDPTNNSLHFGLTKLNIAKIDDAHPNGDDGITLEQNTSPTCEGLNFGANNCSVLGQVIFDPLGFKGGVALGIGQGKNTKLGIIVDKDNNITLNSHIISPIFTSSAGYIENEKRVTGQGTMQTWNMFYPGNAHTEFTNIAPSGGGFDFYDMRTSDVINTKDLEISNNLSKTQPIFRVGKIETFFDVKPTMRKGMNISSSLPISFETAAYDGNNQIVYMFYNPIRSDKKREISERESNRIGYNYTLDQDTFYFTNLRYGNKFKFDGSVGITDTLSAKKIRLQLSTPSSSSESCDVGEFKDDMNYHYVCVATNKWKRVALSDF